MATNYPNRQEVVSPIKRGVAGYRKEIAGGADTRKRETLKTGMK